MLSKIVRITFHFASVLAIQQYLYSEIPPPLPASYYVPLIDGSKTLKVHFLSPSHDVWFKDISAYWACFSTMQPLNVRFLQQTQFSFRLISLLCYRVKRLKRLKVVTLPLLLLCHHFFLFSSSYAIRTEPLHPTPTPYLISLKHSRFHQNGLFHYSISSKLGPYEIFCYCTSIITYLLLGFFFFFWQQEWQHIKIK